MPSDESVEVELFRRYVKLSGGALKPVFSILDHQYRVWRGSLGRWHWSISNWPDDGLGVPSHGSELSLRKAVRACLENRVLRKEVYGR